MLLGLVMIVKNEAHGIAVTLESFKDHIDYWTILDTGSTDGTQDVIRKTLEGVPGDLFEEPFVDFSTSRNRALALHGEKTTFTVMPDSDDRLHNGTLLRAFLTTTELSSAEVKDAPAFLMNLQRGGSVGSYYLPIVFRTAARWRYHGKVHEYAGPEHGEGYATVKIPGVQLTQGYVEQSVEASKKRWERDLVLLQAELAAKPDDPRTLFYLAQTYECLGNAPEAVRTYERRITVGGWAEETFEARLRRAKLIHGTQPWPVAQQAYLEAYESDPRRAEPLFRIAEHWYCAQNHHMAYLFAARAAELPLPDASLFVDEDVYKWRAADIVAISGYYLNDPRAKIAGALAAEQCVRAHPHDERLRSNRAFYAPMAGEMFPGFRSKKIEIETEGEPWVPFNPSVHRDARGRWRCIVRTSNYKIVYGNYITPDDNVIYTRNFMLELDDELRTTAKFEMLDKSGGERSAYPCHGFEDCRLFEHDGQLVFTCTVCDFDTHPDRAPWGPREIVLGEFGDDYAIVRATPLRGPWSAAAQKNWMPTGDGRIVFSVTPNPHGKATVLELRDRQAHWTDLVLGHNQLRGGSQLVKIDEGWLCIVHDVAWPGSRLYLHRFVQLSDDFVVESMSDLFCFQHRGIEFCAGLARDGKRLVASYGVEDQHAMFGVFDLDAVRRALKTGFQI